MNPPLRGSATTGTTSAVCKDCLRETGDPAASTFEYSEQWAQDQLAHGGSRSDRCPEHRRRRRFVTAGGSLTHIDVETVGTADQSGPVAPLGLLGPPPAPHTRTNRGVDLSRFDFGLTDADILELTELLSSRRVVIVEAGTGSGKSTFMPFRLMNPPDGASLQLTDLGLIVVTEPRRQAATGPARFVAEALCQGHDPDECGAHVGPGFPVGYQIKDDRRWDGACRLIYATDGSVVNWLAAGRASEMALLVIDEVHERNMNIELLMLAARDQLRRYPNLRVVVTSATLDVDAFVDLFGGPSQVGVMRVPPRKNFGYGQPFWPGAVIDDPDAWVAEHWPQQFGPEQADGSRQDLHATAKALGELRSSRVIAPENWINNMPEAVADQCVQLALEAPPGDILAFLPSETTIGRAVERVRSTLGEAADVFELRRTLPDEDKLAALQGRPAGAKRRIVVATPIAETSLTVKGVSYVVDSGLVAQNTWDTENACGSVPVQPHSQFGLRQRWGRVGRDAPGWVFPLYTEEQFGALSAETPPAIERENTESFLLKATGLGLDVRDPAVFPTIAAQGSGGPVARELARAGDVLYRSGAIDETGRLTHLGAEMEAFPGSAASARAIVMADQLCCVPEVAVAIGLLESGQLVGRSALFCYENSWPVRNRVAATQSHHALATGAVDDLDVVLTIYSSWELAEDRPSWASRWYVSHEALVAAEEAKNRTLAALAPAMKHDAVRPVDLGLVERARLVLASSFGTELYHDDHGTTRPMGASEGSYTLARTPAPTPDVFFALSVRKSSNGGVNLAGIVRSDAEPVGSLDAVELLVSNAARQPVPGRPAEAVAALARRWSCGTVVRTGTASADGGVVEVVESVSRPTTLSQLQRQVAEDGTGASHSGLCTTDFDPNSTGEPIPEVAVVDVRDDETNDEDDHQINGQRSVDRTSGAGTSPAGAGASERAVPMRDSAVCKPSSWYEVTGYGIEDGRIFVELAALACAPDLSAGAALPPAGTTVPAVVRGQVYDYDSSHWQLDGAAAPARFYVTPPASRRNRSKSAPLSMGLDPADESILGRVEPSGRIDVVVLHLGGDVTASVLPGLAERLAKLADPHAGGPVTRVQVIESTGHGIWVACIEPDGQPSQLLRFQIPASMLRSKRTPTERGTRLDVRFGPAELRRRLGLTPQLGEVVADFPEYLEVTPSVQSVQALATPFPPELVDRLLDACDHEQVWRFVVCACQRRVVEILAADVSPSTPLTARPDSLSPEREPSRTAATVSLASLPGCLQRQVLYFVKDRTDASVALGRDQLRIDAAGESSASAAARLAGSLVTEPLAQVHVPAEMVGLVIGRQGATIRRLQSDHDVIAAKDQTRDVFHVLGRTVAIEGFCGAVACQTDRIFFRARHVGRLFRRASDGRVALEGILDGIGERRGVRPRVQLDKTGGSVRGGRALGAPMDVLEDTIAALQSYVALEVASRSGITWEYVKGSP